MLSLLDGKTELKNRREIRREKNVLYNIKNELEDTIVDSYLTGAVRLTDEQRELIEEAVITIDERIYTLEKELKEKIYKNK